MIKEENGNGARLKLTAGSRPGFNVYGSTNKHDKLKNLEYEKSGHTGFQKELTFDEMPTKDSKNPITSGGVYNGLSDKANVKYLGGVNLNQIFEPGIYTIELRGSSYLPQEVNDLIESDSSRISTYATLKVSPYHLSKHEDDLYPVKNGGVQELTVYFFDEEWNSQVCVYINEVFTDLVDIGGEYGVMCNGWVKIADSRGMGIGGSGDVDLSDYYNKEEINSYLENKVDKEEGKGLSDISGIDHMGHAAVDGTIGGNFVNATEFYHEFIITHQSGVEDSISLYDTEQTCAVIDEKLAEKVSKEEGKGLSTVVSIDISESNDPEILSTAAIRRVNDLMGIPQTIAFYSAAQIDKKLSELPSGGGTDLSNYYTKAEVEAYIEETLLGGAW